VNLQQIVISQQAFALRIS